MRRRGYIWGARQRLGVRAWPCVRGRRGYKRGYPTIVGVHDFDALRAGMPHGRRQRYDDGCRCRACTDANTERQRRKRARRREREAGGVAPAPSLPAPSPRPSRLPRARSAAADEAEDAEDEFGEEDGWSERRGSPAILLLLVLAALGWTIWRAWTRPSASMLPTTARRPRVPARRPAPGSKLRSLREIMAELNAGPPAARRVQLLVELCDHPGFIGGTAALWGWAHGRGGCTEDDVRRAVGAIAERGRRP